MATRSSDCLQEQGQSGSAQNSDWARAGRRSAAKEPAGKGIGNPHGCQPDHLPEPTEPQIEEQRLGHGSVYRSYPGEVLILQ